MAQALRVSKTRSVEDADTQSAIDSLARDVELRSKYGTGDPDSTVSGKIYFKLSATTSGKWTKVSEVWISS